MAQFHWLAMSPIICVCIAAIVTAADVTAAEPQLQTGTVVSASRDSLTIKDKAGKQQSFTVDPAAKITINGKPGKLEDLKETMPVQVMMDEKGKVLTVSTIDKEKRRVWAATIAAVPLER